MRKILNITKALADENRVRALMMLQNGEMCVCNIIDMLNMAPSTGSKHMSIWSKPAGMAEEPIIAWPIRIPILSRQKSSDG